MGHSQEFCFPLPERLENNLVRLVPFVPSEHAEAFFEGAREHPELYRYLPWGPFDTAGGFVSTVIEQRVQKSPGIFLFAVFDKTRSGGPQLAGTIGFLETSAANMSTEIGFVITLPAFQRTHVTRCAVGLITRFALDPPQAGGLGLRRVQWKANPQNERSVRAAERMGFRRECVLRWERVLPPWKTESEGGNGIAVREGDPRAGSLGRDTVVLALCWDDWEGGARDLMEQIL